MHKQQFTVRSRTLTSFNTDDNDGACDGVGRSWRGPFLSDAVLCHRLTTHGRVSNRTVYVVHIVLHMVLH